MFDDIVIGGGFYGISRPFILSSGKYKYSAADKKIGALTHQKTSSLQEAIFNYAYGIPLGN